MKNIIFLDIVTFLYFYSDPSGDNLNECDPDPPLQINNEDLVKSMEYSSEWWTVLVAASIIPVSHHRRQVSQGDAASCATQPTNLSSGRCALQTLSPMSDAAQPKFPSCAYGVTIHTLTKTARVIVCVHVMHERIPLPRKVSDWLILHLIWGFQYDPIFGDYRCGFEGHAGVYARNYANCRNVHTTRTI